MQYRSRPLRDFEHFSRAKLLAWIVVFACFGLLVTQLFRLTVLQHDKYLSQARENLYVTKRLSYPRGNIVDREGVILATNEKTYSLTFNPYGMKDPAAREAMGALGLSADELPESRVDTILATRPRWTRHTLISGVPLERVLPMLERPNNYRGVRVDVGFAREYMMPEEFAHVLGYTSNIQPSEKKLFPRPRYLPDDRVGRSGLELKYQDELAGQPGKERLKRDARGARLDDPELLASSEPGKNLYLTLDSRMQKKAMELLSGEMGTIILMEADTGALVAMASSPTYDPRDPAKAETLGQPSGYMNLSMRGAYAPGSTMKIVGAAAMLRAGADPLRKVTCDGSFRLPGWDRAFHCAVRSGHGPVTLPVAIKESCNVYFFQVGNELGAEPLLEMAREFGFEQKTGIDLPGERVPKLSTSEHPGPGETTNLWIGQGSMLVTPLQVARAYAGIATGSLPTPHVVQAIGLSDDDNQEVDAPHKMLNVPSTDRQVIVEGLWRVVNEPGGTAYKAGIPREWEVAGKTGTAENPQGSNDAWFAGFFPRSNPSHVFVIHIESTDGHGGEVAGPIAKQLIGAMLHPDT
ncbi:MAG: penicillin-binding transpeptidase domain-containing protein, partial [Candidatus Sumerlaeota bacterium]